MSTKNRGKNRKRNRMGEFHPDRVYYHWVGRQRQANGSITILNADGTPSHQYIDCTSRVDALERLKKLYPGRKIHQSSDMFVVYP